VTVLSHAMVFSKHTRNAIQVWPHGG